MLGGDYVGKCPCCGRSLYLGDSDVCGRCEERLDREEQEREAYDEQEETDSVSDAGKAARVLRRAAAKG